MFFLASPLFNHVRVVFWQHVYLVDANHVERLIHFLEGTDGYRGYLYAQT